MPIANRPDPLLPLSGAPNPRATLPGTSMGADRGPGFADWLARARPEPVRPPTSVQQPPRSERAERANPAPQATSPASRPPDHRTTQRPHAPPHRNANGADRLPERETAPASDEAAATRADSLGEGPAPGDDAAARTASSTDRADASIQPPRPDLATPQPTGTGLLTRSALPGATDSIAITDGEAAADADANALSLNPMAISGRSAGSATRGDTPGGTELSKPSSAAFTDDLADAQGSSRPDPLRRGANARALGRGTPEPTDTPSLATPVSATGTVTHRADGEPSLRAGLGGRDALPERGGRAEAMHTGTPLASAGVDPSASLRLGGSSLTATPAAAALAPPLDHPDFAAALGAQVAVWARDGQHEAELRLNPGSLGAVQVWIGVEAGQAQVRFTADLSSTRDALQAALPDLAQALAREGLQLGGADVQSRQQRGESAPGERRPGDRGSRAAPQVSVGLDALPPPRPAGRGLLDLYA